MLFRSFNQNTHMKLLFFFLLLGYSKLSAAQGEPLAFQSVVVVDSVTKQQLYERARLWFNDYFKNAEAVLQVSDKEAGEFIGKPILYTWYNSRYLGRDHKLVLKMPVTIRVRVKDGKYKYEIYDITTYYDADDSPYNEGSARQMFGPLTTSESCPKSYPMVSQSKVDEQWNEAKHNAGVMIEELATALNDYMNNKGFRTVKNDDF